MRLPSQIDVWAPYAGLERKKAYSVFCIMCVITCTYVGEVWQPYQMAWKPCVSPWGQLFLQFCVCSYIWMFGFNFLFIRALLPLRDRCWLISCSVRFSAEGKWEIWGRLSYSMANVFLSGFVLNYIKKQKWVY